MANENVLEIKEKSKISENGSGIFSEAGLSEVDKSLTVESLKTKLLRMKDSLKKMDEIIEDLKNRLHNTDGELDEYMGV
jgi:hypothetical protein